MNARDLAIFRAGIRHAADAAIGTAEVMERHAGAHRSPSRSVMGPESFIPLQGLAPSVERPSARSLSRVV